MEKYLSTFPVRDLDRGRAELLSYGSPGTHTYTQKQKMPQLTLGERYWKCLSKQHSQGCQKRKRREEEGGGKKQFVTGSLYHHFPFCSLLSIESQHQGWMFSSSYIIELFTRYNLLQDWSCWNGRNCFQYRLSAWLHLSTKFHKVLAMWLVEMRWQNFLSPIPWPGLGPFDFLFTPWTFRYLCIVRVWRQKSMHRKTEKGEAVFSSHSRSE